jgi:hypothetical protein
LTSGHRRKLPALRKLGQPLEPQRQIGSSLPGRVLASRLLDASPSGSDPAAARNENIMVSHSRPNRRQANLVAHGKIFIDHKCREHPDVSR